MRLVEFVSGLVGQSYSAKFGEYKDFTGCMFFTTTIILQGLNANFLILETFQSIGLNSQCYLCT